METNALFAATGASAKSAPFYKGHTALIFKLLDRFKGFYAVALTALLVGMMSFNANGQGFAGSYAPANWTLSGGNGSVNTTGAPSSIVFTSTTGTCCSNVITLYQITMPASGTIGFNWSTTGSTFSGDVTFGYRINSTDFSLTGSPSTSGTVSSVSVNAGDVFSFYTNSVWFNSATLITTISNFTGPIACTAPTTQATIAAYTGTGTTSTTVNWSRGNGTAGVIVVGRCTSAALSNPAGGTTYTANAAFGFGSKTGSGNFVVYSGTGTSATVTGLNPGTSYTFTIYEYNTTSTCYKTPGSSSAVSTTGSLSYPAVSGGGCTYDAISGVTINSVVVSSGLTCSGNYVDNTCTGYTGSLTAGSTYTFSVAGNPYPSPSFSNLGFYLDANDNGTFETGEFLGNFTATASPWTGSITIPVGTASGAHRLRIQGM